MYYKNITPFPEDSSCNFPELRALSDVWLEKKTELESSGAYKEFIKKMQREWAIETGIIERLYTWDRGVTEALIEQGIESSIISHKSGMTTNEAHNIKTIIDDHLNIVEGLFSYIKGDTSLSEHFIRGLQAQFTAHQDFTDAITATGQKVKISLLKGEYKRSPNNPKRTDGSLHFYCPPEFVNDEMQKLINFFRDSEKKYEPEVRAAWLHHRFTEIHPFQDGNGRVARALASLVFLQAGLFPLVIRESDREVYIESLEQADDGNLTPLITFFARRQRDSILKALGLEQQVQQNNHVDQVLTSALQLLQTKYSYEKDKIFKVYEHAKKLQIFTESKLNEISYNLDKELRQLRLPGRRVFSARSNHARIDDDNKAFFQKQIIDIANNFDYFANLEKYRSWTRVTIITEHDFDFVISMHGYGYRESGIMAASAFTYIKGIREEGGTEPVNLRPASTDLFQFNYAESYENTESRYSEWLDSALAIGMAEWKKTL